MRLTKIARDDEYESDLRFKRRKYRLGTVAMDAFEGALQMPNAPVFKEQMAVCGSRVTSCHV